jgi:hypothetical protein
MAGRPTCWVLVVFVHLMLSASLSRADAAPKPQNDVVVYVTYEGRRPADHHFRAALLELVALSDRRGGRTRNTMDLAKLPLTEADGRRWMPAHYEWGGDGANGQVRFQGFHPPDRSDPGGGWPPKYVRLAVYLPSQGTFLTDVTETRPYLTFLKADLRVDGTGSLLPSWESLWQRLAPLYALAITLFIELSIIVAYGWYRRIPLARLVIVGVIVNVISLPVVWFVTLESYSELGRFWGFGCLLLAELVAALFEGLAYAWLGRLGPRAGLCVSFVANAVSMLLGLLL